MKTLLEVFGEYSAGRKDDSEAEIISAILDDLSPEDQVDRIREYAREVAQDALSRVTEEAIIRSDILAAEIDIDVASVCILTP